MQTIRLNRPGLHKILVTLPLLFVPPNCSVLNIWRIWACHKLKRTSFRTWKLAVDGSLYDCGEIRAKLAMVWIHWIRLPFSTLFAFCWRLQQMCMNNVWRRKLAFTVMWKLKATKCYTSRQAKRYIMCTAQHECPTDCCIFRFIIDGSNCMRYNYLKQKKSVNPFFKKKTYR